MAIFGNNVTGSYYWNFTDYGDGGTAAVLPIETDGYDYAIDDMRIQVDTQGVANIKACVWSITNLGPPGWSTGNILHVGSAVSRNGYGWKTLPLSYTLSANTQYFIGFIVSVSYPNDFWVYYSYPYPLGAYYPIDNPNNYSSPTNLDARWAGQSSGGYSSCIYVNATAIKVSTVNGVDFDSVSTIHGVSSDDISDINGLDV